MNGSHGCRGFTLVELVVAVAVGGIVLLAGFGALTTVQDRSVHALEASTTSLSGAAARATLVEWVAGARLRSTELGEEFQGLDAAEHALPSDELAFPTSAETPVRAPVTFVRLHIATDPIRPERGLVAELVGGQLDEPRFIELAPQAIDLRVRYLPATQGPVEWTESWFGQDELPRGVEITLLDDPADPLPELLRLPIRVSLAVLR